MNLVTQNERFPIDGRPGYFLDNWGFEFFAPSPDPADARRRLVAMIGEPAPPLVSAVAIDGRLPSAEQVAAVERELHKAPPTALDDFKSRGGKIEVIAGANATRHPVTSPKRNMGSCGGWYCDRYGLICIAAEADPLTVPHELGHHFDRFDGRDWGRFSSLPLWRRLSEPGPWERRFHSPWEKFAESFALHFHSNATRDRLGDSIQSFIERVCV